MKNAIIVKAAAVALVVTLAGCTDRKPLQAEDDQLTSQVAKLQSDVTANATTAASASAAANQAATAAMNRANAANTAAQGAQNTANQALAAAQAAQAGVDATNEKIDRMFKRSISK
jgi:predicted small lipoprotein YifL